MLISLDDIRREEKEVTSTTQMLDILCHDFLYLNTHQTTS